MEPKNETIYLWSVFLNSVWRPEKGPFLWLPLILGSPWPENPVISWPLFNLILQRPEKCPDFWPPFRYRPRWPEKRQISWPVHDCETRSLSQQASRLANTPANCSKQAARATPKGSESKISLCLSHKRQCRDADPNLWRKDGA